MSPLDRHISTLGRLLEIAPKEEWENINDIIYALKVCNKGLGKCLPAAKADFDTIIASLKEQHTKQ